MKKGLQLLAICLVAFLLVWLFPTISVGVGAPDADVDIRLVKTSSPDPVTAGNILTYTLAITNTGPSTATGVLASDTLPGGVIYQAATSSCAFATGTVTCVLGDLVVNGSGLVTITVQVDPSTRGTITNTASVTSTDTDLDLQNNSALAATTVNATAELGLAKDDGTTQVVSGDGVIYTYAITVTNAGPSEATSVVLTDTWPIGFTRGVVTPSQGSCDTLTNPSDFTCQFGSISVGGQGTVTANYTVPPATPAGIYTNSVQASSPEAAAPVNASDANALVAIANLAIAKSDGVSLVTAGDGMIYTYTITVINAGPSIASSVTLTDTWPAGFTRGTVTPSQGSCDTLTSPTDFSCALGSIPVDGSRTVTAAYTVPPATPAGTYTNSVQASSPETGAPVSASDANTVVVTANLAIAKDDGVSLVTAGDGAIYTYAITVTNTGPSLASSVVLTDTWPSGFTRGTVTSSQGSCDTLTSPGDFTCQLGSIQPGGRGTITAAYAVPPATLAGTYTNSVVVRSGAGDADFANNTASDETVVQTRANLSLSMSDNPDPVFAGDLLTYTLTVANPGPSNAVGVNVTDTLPTSTSFVSGGSSPGCASGAGTVTCNLGLVLAGGSRQVIIRASVNPTATGTLTNSAFVTATTIDPQPANNQAEALTAIRDVEPPSLTWVLPVPDEGTLDVGCEIVRLEVDATDNVQVQRVRFYWWDPLAGSTGSYIEIGNDTTAPYQWDFSTCGLHPRYNQVFAEAYDAWGNQSERKRILLYKIVKLFMPLMIR